MARDRIGARQLRQSSCFEIHALSPLRRAVSMRRVSDLTRLWIVYAPPPSGVLLAGVASAPIVALLRDVRAPEDLTPHFCALWRIDSTPLICLREKASAFAAVGESGPPPGRDSSGLRHQLSHAPSRSFDDLAREHAGGQIGLIATREVAHAALSRALRNSGPTSEAPTCAWNVVVDWPAREAPHLTVGLIGVDLDWVPPPPPRVLGRFPGGPGSAATHRS